MAFVNPSSLLRTAEFSEVTASPRPDSYRVNSVICADCLDVLGKMRPESVDLTVFSPPYDGIRDYKNEWSLDVPAAKYK